MRRTVLLSLLSLTAVPLVAQEAQPSPAAAPAWTVMVGGGGILMPSYPGADEHTLFTIPFLKVSYRDRVYLGPSSGGNGMGIGVNAVRTGPLAVIGEIGFSPDRPADRADALAGMDDRSFVGTATVAAAYTFGPAQLAANATHGMNDGSGTMISGQLGAMLPVIPGVMTSVAFGATWADGRQMRREFGVSTVEASRRQALLDAGDDRLPSDAGVVYAPESGLRNVSASIQMIRPLSQKWAIVGLGSVERLGDEAAASSLVRRRVQVTGGLLVGYAF
jgi:outer membrane protein